MQIKAAVEAMLFLADKPLRAELMAFILGVETDAVRKSISLLNDSYRAYCSALEIKELTSIDAFDQLLTENDFAILDRFDPTEKLQDACPLVTTLLSAPTFKSYAIDTKSEYMPGFSVQSQVFENSIQNTESQLQEDYEKLQAELMTLRREVSQNITDELKLESEITKLWQQTRKPTEAAQLQNKWEALRTSNASLRERLASMETTVQNAYIQKQNSLAFVRLSAAISRAKHFLAPGLRKRLLAIMARSYTFVDTRRRIEYMLFHTGDEFTAKEMANLLGEPIKNINSALKDLQAEYDTRNAALHITGDTIFRMQILSDLADLPFLRTVPQTIHSANNLIERLSYCRDTTLEAAQFTATQVDYWHKTASLAVSNNEESQAKKTLTYWLFCKEQFESLQQISDSVGLLIARLGDLSSTIARAPNHSAQTIVVQNSATVQRHSALSRAQDALDSSINALQRIDDLMSRSKREAEAWRQQAALAAEKQNDDLEAISIERQTFFEATVAQIEQQSLQGVFLHEFIRDLADHLAATSDIIADDLCEESRATTCEFSILTLAELQTRNKRSAVLSIPRLIGVQAEHLLSIARACTVRSVTYTKEQTLENRAAYLSLQLAQLESMLSDSKLDENALGPNPFTEMATQLESELALLKETYCKNQNAF